MKIKVVVKDVWDAADTFGWFNFAEQAVGARGVSPLGSIEKFSPQFNNWKRERNQNKAAFIGPKS